MPDDCIFCKIAAGQIPSEEVYSDPDFYAFRDIHPAAPTHVQVIPRLHIAKLTDIGTEHTELMGQLLLCVKEIAVRENLVKCGFRCVLNCGEGGGQLVMHLHMHILAGRELAWPPG